MYSINQIIVTRPVHTYLRCFAFYPRTSLFSTRSTRVPFKRSIKLLVHFRPIQLKNTRKSLFITTTSFTSMYLCGTSDAIFY